MEYEILAKLWSYQYVVVADIRKFSLSLESLHFRPLPQNVVNAKFEQRDGS